MKEKKLRFKKNIKNKIIKTFLILVIIVSTCVMLFSIYKIILWHIDNKKNNNLANKIIENTEINEIKPTENAENINPPENKFDPYYDYVNMSLLDVDFNDLLKKNKDTVGWINVGGTKINYPVVQSTNNDYYLNHSFDKSYNSAGWAFMDYRNDSKNYSENTIIYAHSRVDGSMFHSLRNILKDNWYNTKKYHIVKYSTPTENTLWQVFSVYTVPAESYYITPAFATDEDFTTWINTMLKRSKYNFNTTVTTDDKILTLSSCYNTNNIRMVLHAKLIKVEKK